MSTLGLCLGVAADLPIVCMTLFSVASGTRRCEARWEARCEARCEARGA
jgi:hypothetical protein